MIDLADTLQQTPEADLLARTAVQHRAASVLRPQGAFERLDDIATWLAGWQRTDTPAIKRPALLIAVASEGASVAETGAWEPNTRAMLDAVRAGVATSTVLAESLGASVRVVDVGVGRQRADLAAEDAMTSDDFEDVFEIGRQAVREMRTDLLLVGEIGVGDTTPALAVTMALFGGAVDEWVGSATLGDTEATNSRLAAVNAAVDRVRPVAPLEALRRLGGLEMAAIAGAVLEARVLSIPVLLDGLVTTAAVAPLQILFSGALDHTMAAHRSAEPGHGRLLQKLGLQPLLELNLSLGEGSGALIALPIVRAAALAVSDVATADEWGLQ